MKRTIFTAIISLFIAISSFAQSGTCGSNLTWNINAEGVLTISGTGAMTDYFYTSGNITTAPWGVHASLLKSLVISDEITHIGKYAFWGCNGFTGDLTIPNSVKTIGEFAFRGCSGFKGSLIISNLMEVIGDGTFAFCSGFTGSLTIPNSVKTIGAEAFNSCSGFTGGLTIGDLVETIGRSAFSECKGFTGSLDIPNLVVTIGDYAFSGCRGFTGSLTIGNSVKTIKSAAFSGCIGFTGDLTIPNSVVTIGEYAFNGCVGFTSIESKAVAPPTATANTFNGINKAIPVYVPSGTLADYKAATGWKDFTNMTEIGGSTGIKDNIQAIARVYPNADGTFTVDVTGSETYNVTVVNMQGQVVKRETVTGGSHIINISNQPAGVYMFVVDNGKQKATVKGIKRN